MTRRDVNSVRRRWRQLRLRTFIAICAVAAISAGLIGRRVVYVLHLLKSVPEIEDDGVQLVSNFHVRYGFYAFDPCGRRKAVLEWSLSNPDYAFVKSPTGGSTDELMKRIASLRTLQEVHASNISLQGLRHMLKLRQLRSLSLNNSVAGEEAVQILLRLPNLRFLTLTNSPVTDRSLHQFAQMHQLQEITLLNTNVTPVGIHRLKRVRPDLRVTTHFPRTALANKRPRCGRKNPLPFVGTKKRDSYICQR